jgi:murein tripeptide amidase MpaA
MLENSVFYFIPVINADGSALVERHWNSEKKILNKRKNNNPKYKGSCQEED